MVQRLKIEFIKDTEKFKIGEQAEAAKDDAQDYVSSGIAKYIEQPKDSIIITKEVKKKTKKKLTEKAIASENLQQIQIAQTRYLQQQTAEPIAQFFDYFDLANQLMNIQPFYYDTAKIWWFWNKEEYKWKIVDEIGIMNAIDANAKVYESTKSHIKNEILEVLKRVSRKNIPIEKEKTWIQFKDTIYDIKSNKAFKAKSSYFLTNPIPWKLGKSEETPTIDKIFKEWVGEKYIQTLYEIIAYCLLPDYPMHRIFCFVGEGLNGKSSYLELIAKFIGKDNITSTELDVLMDSRFEITRLHKKLVCQMGETNFSEMKKTAILKKLTGRDLIGFEYKNKDPFEDYNYAKILISTNNLPATTDKTIGFYRRWILIDFPNQFDETKDILDDIPQEEIENMCYKSIHILQNLLKKRVFHEEGSIEERVRRYEERSNPLEKFFKENIEEDVDCHIFKHDFRKVLDEWCKENRFRQMTDRSVGLKMKELGIQIGKIYADWITKEGEKPRLRAWLDIKWKEGKTKNPL